MDRLKTNNMNNIKDFDLTTEKGRKEALDFLSFSFESELRDNVEGFANGLGIRIRESIIDLFLSKDGDRVFGSIVHIYPNKKRDFLKDQKAAINYGSSGEFSPNDKGSYWRTIHAALILQNWDFVIGLTVKYCNKYIELRTQIGLLKNK